MLELHNGCALLPYLDMVGDLVRCYGYAVIADCLALEAADEDELVEDSFMVEAEEERAVAEGQHHSQLDGEEFELTEAEVTITDASGCSPVIATNKEQELRLKLINAYILYTQDFKNVRFLFTINRHCLIFMPFQNY